MSAPQSQPPVTDPHHLLSDHSAEETAGKKSGWRKWIVLAVILLIAGIIVWRIRSQSAADKLEAEKAALAADRPVPVQTVPVVQKTVPVFLSALGTVTAYNTVTLSSRVDGQLLRVNFVEGQQVHKGQLLLEIDPRPYQASLDQAIGTLNKDEANVKYMQAEAQRYTALYEAGVVSREQQQLEVSNAGQAQGSIVTDKAAVESARVNLAYTKIYSPIDGVVGLRQVDPGNIVHAADSTGLVVITQVHPIAVVFTLPEDQIPLAQEAMKGGKKLKVEAYDRADAHKLAEGTLLTIDNQIDTTTGTAKVKAIFDNQDNTLFANQFVNVRLILHDRANATVIPTASIESGTQGDYVFVVNAGATPDAKKKNLPASTRSAEKTASSEASQDTESESRQNGKYHADSVPVHVDFVVGTMSVISDGMLQAGQQVVVDGQEKLVDGANVQPQAAKSTVVPANSAGQSTSGGSGLTSGSGQAVPQKGQHAHNNSGPGSTVSAGNGGGGTQ